MQSIRSRAIILGIFVGASLWLLWPAAPLPRSVLKAPAPETTRRIASRARPHTSSRDLHKSELAAPSVESTAEMDPEPRRFPIAAALLAPPRWQPRPAHEWQGMLVNLNLAAPCESTSVCGLAQACKTGRCLPCENDTECDTGEACVLDHCIPDEHVGCRTSRECPERSLCVIDGYSNQPRGNETMHSSCLDVASGAGTVSHAALMEPAPDHRGTLPDQEFIEQSRKALYAE